MEPMTETANLEAVLREVRRKEEPAMAAAIVFIVTASQQEVCDDYSAGWKACANEFIRHINTAFDEGELSQGEKEFSIRIKPKSSFNKISEAFRRHQCETIAGKVEALLKMLDLKCDVDVEETITPVE
jgi:hypothetical protein